MSAAQALTSGPLASAPSARSSSSGSAAERGDASFRDTLETVSRSGDGAENEAGRLPSERARGRKGGGHEDSGRDGDEGPARAETAASQPRAETSGASELSAMLAALGGAPDARGGEMERSAPAGTVSADAAAGEAWPWFPGQVGESGEALDAGRLFALLKSGAASGDGVDAQVDRVDIKVTVAGQETHLALDSAPSDALAALAVTQDSVDATTSDGNDNGKAAAHGAALGAALSQAVNGEARRRSGAVGGDIEAKGEAGAGASRAAPVSEQWSGRALASLEQGIAGHDGRQSEGRGGSGAGSSQPQGTAAFMAALLGTTAQAAGAVLDASEAGPGAEPVSDQIAAGVRTGLEADGLGETSTDGVVRVLHLELKPANLGSVTVRLALKDNAITIHIEAQQSDTLAIIERERAALAGALASAGYSVDGITAAPQGDFARSQGMFAGLGNSGSPGPQGGHAGQAGSGQGFGNSSGGQSGSGQAGAGNSAYRHPSDDKDVNGGGVRRGADGLYV